VKSKKRLEKVQKDKAIIISTEKHVMCSTDANNFVDTYKKLKIKQQRHR